MKTHKDCKHFKKLINPPESWARHYADHGECLAQLPVALLGRNMELVDGGEETTCPCWEVSTNITEKDTFVAMLDRVGIKHTDTQIGGDDPRVGGIEGVTQVSIASYDGVRNASYPEVVLHCYGEGGTDFFFSTEGALLSVLAWGQ